MAKQVKKTKVEEPIGGVLEEKKVTPVEETVTEEVPTEEIKDANELVNTANPVVEESEAEDSGEKTFLKEVEEKSSMEEVPTEEPPTEEALTEEPSTEEAPAEDKNLVGLSDEKILDMAEQIKKEGESLKDIKELTPEVGTILKEKITHLEDIENELRKDIERGEELLKKENKAGADKLFRRGFSEFWNGVSDGWNN